MNGQVDDVVEHRYRVASGVLVKLGQLDARALTRLGRCDEAGEHKVAECRHAAEQALSNSDREIYRWAARRCIEMVEYADLRDRIQLMPHEIVSGAAAASDAVLDALVPAESRSNPLLAERWREVAGEPTGGSDIREVMNRASPSTSEDSPARPFRVPATSPAPIHDQHKGATRRALTPAQVKFRARASLAFGIVGLLCLGVVAGVPAIMLSRSARRRSPLGIERDTAFVAELGSFLGWLSLLSTAVGWLVIVGHSN